MRPGPSGPTDPRLMRPRIPNSPLGPPSSPPRYPPQMGPGPLEPVPEPLPSPQRNAVNLATALTPAPEGKPNLGDGLLTPQVTAPPPQAGGGSACLSTKALQPGRVTVPPRQPPQPAREEQPGCPRAKACHAVPRWLARLEAVRSLPCWLLHVGPSDLRAGEVLELQGSEWKGPGAGRTGG